MNPALAAWMGDADARGRAREAVSAFAHGWARDTPLPALARALDALVSPGAEEVAALVRPLLMDTGWAAAIVARLIAEVGRDPFFEPPLVALHSDVQAGLVLYAGHHAVIGLGVGALDRLAAKKRRRAEGSIAFPGHASLIRVLAGGGATLSLWDGGWQGGALRDPCRHAGRHRLTDGELLEVDGRTTSFLVDHAQADMLLLHATILADTAPTACEYDRTTLRLVATGAASERASRTQLLTTLLAALDRPDAEAFDAASRAPEPFVRWHAMREWLALDAEAAAPPPPRGLDAIAVADPDPELRALGRADGLLNATAIEGLLPLAAHMGGGNGEDLLRHLMRRHPVDRIRIGAMQALAGAATGPHARHALLEHAARLDEPVVTGAARDALVELPAILAWAAGRS